jgi:hypothetical protein
MKVIYGKNEYKIDKELDSQFISNLFECTNNNEVVLYRYEESFKLILNGLENTDLTLIPKDEMFTLYEGLKYFMVSEDFLNKFRKISICNIFLIKEAQKRFENYLKANYNMCPDILINNYTFSTNNLSEEFIENNIKNKKFTTDWYNLCENENYSTEFFERIVKNYPYRILVSNICKNSRLSLDFFEKIFDGDFTTNILESLCENKSIPVEFFEKIIKEGKDFNRSKLFLRDFPGDFFERIIQIETINKEYEWDNLYSNKYLPEKFFEKIIKEGVEDRTNWIELCENKNLSMEFFKKLLKGEFIELQDDQERLIKRSLCWNKNISQEFVEEILLKVDNPGLIEWAGLFKVGNFSADFFEKLIDIYKKIDSCYEAKHYLYLCWNKNVPLNILEKIFIDNIQDIKKWSNKIVKNKGIPFEFLEKYIHILDPEELINFRNAPLSFFKRNGIFPAVDIINSTIIYDILPELGIL